MYVVWSTRAQTHRTQTRSSSLSGHRSAQNPVPSMVSPNYIAAKDRDNDTRITSTFTNTIVRIPTGYGTANKACVLQHAMFS